MVIKPPDTLADRGAALMLEKVNFVLLFDELSGRHFPFDKQYLVLFCTMLISRVPALARSIGHGHRLKFDVARA
jgi:hypothetical protein